jgi:hypothetical protein
MYLNQCAPASFNFYTLIITICCIASAALKIYPAFSGPQLLPYLFLDLPIYLYQTRN